MTGLSHAHLSGPAIYVAWLARYSARMFFFFPLALVVIGLVHYEAFRTLQAMFLPLLTALLAMLWSLGLLGLLGVALDPFNVTTPILILAVAAGHAVQMLKRFYEEFARATGSAGCGRAARSPRSGPVMIVAAHDRRAIVPLAVDVPDDRDPQLRPVHGARHRLRAARSR